jgi:hypothetical protein
MVLDEGVASRVFLPDEEVGAIHGVWKATESDGSDKECFGECGMRKWGNLRCRVVEFVRFQRRFSGR